jgi:hypothetical protein
MQLMSRGKERMKSFSIALPAVFSAFSLVMLYIACVVPSGLWGLVAVAGLGPLAVVASIGVREGLLCWAGSSILAFLLLPDKFCAMLFVLLFGVYPIVKSVAEKTRSVWKSVLIKLGFFNLSVSVLFLTMGALMTAALPDIAEGKLWLIYLGGNIIFLVYDLGLNRLISFYLVRIDRIVRRNGR